MTKKYERVQKKKAIGAVVDNIKLASEGWIKTGEPFKKMQFGQQVYNMELDLLALNVDEVPNNIQELVKDVELQTRRLYICSEKFQHKQVLKINARMAKLISKLNIELHKLDYFVDVFAPEVIEVIGPAGAIIGLRTPPSKAEEVKFKKMRDAEKG